MHYLRLVTIVAHHAIPLINDDYQLAICLLINIIKNSSNGIIQLNNIRQTSLNIIIKHFLDTGYNIVLICPLKGRYIQVDDIIFV